MPRPDQTVNLIVDLSDNVANVDFTRLRAAGVDAVILKATEGATYQDRIFNARLPQAVASGLKVGVFHFGTKAPLDAQVSNFITTVGGFAGLVPFVDVEQNEADPGNTMTPDMAEQWVQIFRARTQLTPGVYAGAYLRAANGAVGRPNLQSCPLWLAAYQAAPYAMPGWQDWTLWQYTDGRLGTYAGAVDGAGLCDQSGYNAAAATRFDDFWQSLAGPA
jgi:lysozyme